VIIDTLLYHIGIEDALTDAGYEASMSTSL